ncbi:hypothetical protein GF406_05875 [candidate division KSB1 bacterium]|nr:hypothetical protein [candidate division KSB1 bacterium]
MRELNRDESGWLVANSWLSALEETARDFHGNRPKAFCERAYEHATESFLRDLETEYGIYPQKTDSIRGAIEEYIRLGVIAGLFEDASQFELFEVNPNRVEIRATQCPYERVCKDLSREGVSLQDLTCARLGCFRAAVKLLAGIDCTYEISELENHGCQGYIERR